MVRVVPAVAMAAFLAACASGQRVRRLTGPPSRSSEVEIYYALPRAVVLVDLPVRATTWEPAQCAGATAAAKAIGLDLTGAGTTRHRVDLAGNPSLDTRTEPDDAQVFAVALTRKSLEKLKSTFELSERGLLAGSTHESEDQAVAWAAKTLEAATTLVPSLVGLGAVPGRPAEEGCVARASRILDLRRDYRILVSGKGQTNGTPRDALELMMKELKALEAAELEAFVGRRTAVEATIRCEVAPAADLRPGEPVATELFALGDGGVVAAPDGPCRVPAELGHAKGGAGDGVRVLLEVVPERDGFLDLVRGAQRPEPPGAEGGLRYRIPRPARFAVVVRSGKDGTEISRKASLRKLIPQLGVVALLPGDGDASDASSKIAATFHGDLGMLKALSMESSPPGTSALGPAADLGKALADEDRKRRDAAAGKELADLEARKKRLELEKAIRDLEAERGATGP